MRARTAAAVLLVALGSMYLWSSPAFVTPADVRPDAPEWSGRFFDADSTWSQGLLRTSLLVVTAFAVAAWGLHRGRERWPVAVAAAAAALGVLVLLPWWFAVGASASWASLAVNAALFAWSLGLAVALLTPALRGRLVRAAGVGAA